MFFCGSLGGQTQGSSSGDGSISNSFNVGPEVGYFVNEKWAVGASVAYAHSNQLEDQVQTPYVYHIHNFSYSISPGFLVRRYFIISDKFLFLLEGGVSYSRSNETQVYETTNSTNPGTTTTTSSDYPEYSVAVTVRPLFIFFPTPNWGFEAGLGSLAWSHAQYLFDNASQNTLTLSHTGLTFIGIFYYLRKKN